MTRFKKIIIRLWYVVGTLIILAALLVSLSRLLTPILNEHLPDFERWSSDLLKVPVKIREVKISWAAYEPQIQFNEVTLLDKVQHKPQFTIQEIVVNLSLFRSLIEWKPLTETIKVAGMHLTIRQPTTSAHLLVDELKDLAVTDVSTGVPSNLTEVLGWLFAQPNLILEDVDIDYHLPSGMRKSITVEQLTLQNSSSTHRLMGAALLNQEIPMHMQMNLTWNGNVVDFNNLPSNLSAHLYLYIEAFSLPQWLGQYTWQNLQIKQGIGSARIWATWSNSELQKIQSQFQVYDVQLESLLTHETQDVPRLSGHVGWKRDGQKQIFAGSDILIDLPNHLWPTTSFAVTVLPTPTNSYAIQDLHIGYLDLDDTKDIALASNLLPDKVVTIINGLNPKGELRNFYIKIPNNGSVTDYIALGLGSQFSGLTVNPWEKYPGITNATGIFDWDGAQGNLRLDSQKMSISVNQLFEKPLQFDQLFAIARWQRASDGSWFWNLSSFHALNADLNANGVITLTVPVKDSPSINLSSSFTVLNVENISHYLPLQSVDPDLAKWLRNAFLGGTLQSGKAILQGKLVDFPFDKKNGTFTVSGIANDVTLNYAPDWPSLQHLNGDLVFSGHAMTVDVVSGQTLGANLQTVHAEIPYIGADQPQILHVQGNIQADISEGLKFIRKSPLQNSIGKDMTGMELKGPVQMKLGLIIPVRTPEKSEVQGNVLMSNVNMALPQWNDLTIDKLNGSFQFTENDLQANNLQGVMFDHPATLSFATQHEPNKPAYLKANLQSVMNVSALEAWSKLPLTKYAQGSSSFQAELHLAHAEADSSEIILKSDLQGIEVNLPDPYGKKADDVSHLQFDISLNPDQTILAKIMYGKLVTAALSYKNVQGMKFNSGEVRLGGGAASIPSQPGLVVTAEFMQLDWNTIQPYWKWINSQMSSLKTSVGVAKQDITHLFRSINIDALKADFFGQHLDDARVQLSLSNHNWLLNINSNQIVGQATIADNFSQVNGNFQRLYFTPAATLSQQSAIDPKTLPILSLNISDVRYGNIDLGSVELLTRPTQDGLMINQLQVNSDVMNLQASGFWRSSQVTNLQGNLTTKNVSALLSQWGINASALVVNNGSAQFNLSWPDAPYNPSIASMEGDFGIKLAGGRITNLSNTTQTSIGFGRLLNFLSLQSIPNFSTFFQKGYDFTSATADFSLAEGNAYTNNLRIEGSLANIDLSGRIGLKAKDYDILVTIVANVSAGLPIAATIVSGFNPIVGVATWAVDKVVGSQVNRVSTYHYKITGPWSDPAWSQVGAGGK